MRKARVYNIYIYNYIYNTLILGRMAPDRSILFPSFSCFGRLSTLVLDLTPNPQVEAQVYLSDYVSGTWRLMAWQQWQSWTVIPFHSILDLLGPSWVIMKSSLPRHATAELPSIVTSLGFGRSTSLAANLLRGIDPFGFSWPMMPDTCRTSSAGVPMF